MRSFVAVAVIGAAVAIVVWATRMLSRDLRSPEPRGRDYSASELSKAALGGAIVVSPVLVSEWVGLSSWVPIAWLIFTTLVLLAALVRKQRRVSAQPRLEGG